MVWSFFNNSDSDSDSDSDNPSDDGGEDIQYVYNPGGSNDNDDLNISSDTDHSYDSKDDEGIKA